MQTIILTSLDAAGIKALKVPLRQGRFTEGARGRSGSVCEAGPTSEAERELVLVLVEHHDTLVGNKDILVEHENILLVLLDHTNKNL